MAWSDYNLIPLVSGSKRMSATIYAAQRWVGNGGTLNLTPYTVTSGTNTWGTAITLLSNTQTPLIAGRLNFSIKYLETNAASTATAWALRTAWGIGGTYADAITAGNYTEAIYTPVTTTNARVLRDIGMPLLPSGVYTVWASGWNATAAATLKFFIGIIEPEETA